MATDARRGELTRVPGATAGRRVGYRRHAPPRRRALRAGTTLVLVPPPPVGARRARASSLPVAPVALRLHLRCT